MWNKTNQNERENEKKNKCSDSFFYIKKTHSKEWSEPVVNCVWVRCKINCDPVLGVVYLEIV